MITHTFILSPPNFSFVYSLFRLLEPLTHGYRRIPIMQIGNNVYCDTAIILDELERRFPEPAISSGPAGSAGLVDVFASWVDVSVRYVGRIKKME